MVAGLSGYTPLFSSLTTGTLCGRWPDIGLWPIVLSLADKNGVVDVTPAYIAGVTGLPLPEVMACMKRFCEPDPYSRSSADEGARLTLIDDHRDWGWFIVNHGKYREKARLASKSAREVEEGKNRARLAEKAAETTPPLTAAHRRSPPETAAERPSYSNANSNKEKKVPSEPMSTSSTAPAKPPDPVETVFEHWRVVHAHPKAQLDVKRRKLIRAALSRYSEADLCLAISGYLNSPHHMGRNDTGTKYTGLELFLRDANHIDAGLQFYAEPPRTGMSALTRKNIDAVADWVPPEMRRAAS